MGYASRVLQWKSRKVRRLGRPLQQMTYRERYHGYLIWYATFENSRDTGSSWTLVFWDWRGVSVILSVLRELTHVESELCV